MTVCHFCKKPVAIEKNIPRTEVCPNCQSDLHCCLNCKFYDRSVHNQCREPQAEWIPNKEKANFCDYFVFADRAAAPAGGQAAPVGDSTRGSALKKLDELFKKS